MTELQNNEINSQVSGISNQSVSPAAAPSRTYTDEEVNSILSAKKDKWIEKGYEKAKAEQGVSNGNGVAQNGFSPSVNNQPSQVSPDQLREMAKEEAEKAYQAKLVEQQNQHQMMQFQNAANQFTSKLEAGKKDYPDVEKSMVNLKLVDHPELWLTANQFDNPAAIIDAMDKDVDLYSQALTLKSNPVKLKEKMQLLADSIKKNKEAEAATQANPPLSRQKPSTVGAESGKDKSEFTIQDWKKILRR